MRAAVRSSYVWLGATVLAQAVGLSVVCLVGIARAFMGYALGQVLPVPLMFGFGVILSTKLGFTWAATSQLRHGRMLWRLTWGGLVLWTFFAATRPFLI